jgi:hypothetical protein
MLKDKNQLADVVLELDIKSNAVMDFYNDYRSLTMLD